MADAGGTTTLKQIMNVGEYTMYEISNDSVDSTETIPFDGPSNSPVKAEDQVIILGATNETTETQAADGTLTVAYDETNMHFTVTESNAADDTVTIVFLYKPQ
jgi:hypothetical protein